MTVLTKRAVEVFAPTTAGGQLRGADMAESATWGTEVERGMEGAAAGRVDQATWAGLTAIAGTRAGQPAIVYGPDTGTHVDPVTGATVANVGEYYWSVSPAGWRRVGNLQRFLVWALNTGAGTANAVQAASSDGQFSQAAYAALITVNFVAANTGAMTLSINGEAPRQLVTNTGDPIPANYVRAGMAALVQIDSAGRYRLFSYGDAAAIQAAAEAAASTALSARDATIAAMSSVVPNTFATKAVASAYAPAVAPDFIQLAGYSVSGDGGGALYKKVASEPSHSAKFSITLSGGGGAVWYELAESVVFTKMLGAVADGATDDTTAINNAVSFIKAVGARELVVSPGRHLCASQVVFDLPDYSKLTFMGSIRSSAAVSPLVRIGSTSTTKSTFGLVVTGIEVDRATIGTGTVVELRSLAFSKVSFRRVMNGSVGVLCIGAATNGGFSYNQLDMGFHHDSTVNLQLNASGTGYCNENIFSGGSFNHSSGWPAATPSVNIEVSHFAASPLNNNRFISPSLEDNQAATYARAMNIAGSNNVVLYPRMENPTDQANYLISLGVNSNGCRIEGQGFHLVGSNVSDAGTGNTVSTLEGTIIKSVAPNSPGYATLALMSYLTSAAKVLSARDSSNTETAFIRGTGEIQGTAYNMSTVPVIDVDRNHRFRSYTVAGLPTPTPGTLRVAWASNCRAFNGAGVQEGAGAGTGALVIDNGTAWKIIGTNVTAVA